MATAIHLVSPSVSPSRDLCAALVVIAVHWSTCSSNPFQFLSVSSLLQPVARQSLLPYSITAFLTLWLFVLLCSALEVPMLRLDLVILGDERKGLP